MMKMIYVSCHVPENRLWELLRLLEAARVGNVETRAIIPVVEERKVARTKSLDNSNGLDSRDRPKVTAMVRKLLKVGREYSVKGVSKELGMKNTSVHTAFGNMIRAGQMQRIETGRYVRLEGPSDVEAV